MPRIPPISMMLSGPDPHPGIDNRERREPGSSLARTSRYNHPVYASDPLTWTRRFLKFFPDPIQADLLQAQDPLILLNCTRQWGKTTIVAAKALHFALFHPNTTTLIAAPSERQSLLFLRRLQSFLDRLGLKTTSVPGLPFSIHLPNGSEIFALPAKADTTRGFTAHLLIFDEAARIPDDLIHALSPTRATTNGPVWLLSTPNGPTGFFYDAWHGNETAYRRFRVPASDCPRITQAFLDFERLVLGDVMFRQEYLCEFIAGPHTMFSLELLESAIDPTLLPLFPGPLWN